MSGWMDGWREWSGVDEWMMDEMDGWSGWMDG